MTPKQAACRFTQDLLDRGYAFEAMHEYRDRHGEFIYANLRFTEKRTGKKWLRAMMVDGGAYVLGRPRFREGAPLYRIPDLVARPDDIVVVVEGEKCADILASRGVLATTCGGADSAPGADWRPLAGRHIILWPDNDAPGVRCMQSARDMLRALNAYPTVRTIDVASLGLPPKGDAEQWAAAHPQWTADDVLALAPDVKLI